MNVAVAGLGKVGLPIAAYFSSVGHTVTGFDTDVVRCSRLINGEILLPWEPETFPLTFAVDDTFDPHVDIVYVIVPTPIVGNTLSSELVMVACHDLRDAGFTGLIVVGSTLDPRSIKDLPHYYEPLAYSPPLIRLGQVVADLRYAKVCLIGGDHVPMVADLWRNHAEVVSGDLVSIATAKLAINTSLSMRIAWANEIALMCSELGADTETVIDALRADPRIGSGYLAPGWPPGGPCLPRDLAAWTSIHDVPIARRVQLSHGREALRLISEVGTMIIQRRDPRVAVLGLMYNPGALDVTYSFGEGISNWLVEHKVPVLAYDPACAVTPFKFNFPIGLSAQEIVDQSNVVVIATAWDEFKSVNCENKFVIDMTRPIR